MAKTHSTKHKRSAQEAGGSPGISLGEKLRRSREAMGLSLEEIFEKTKLRPSVIESIEQERWEALPAPAFVKGFLRAYARVLEIDEREIIRLYEAELPEENRPFEAILTKKRGTKIRWVVAVVIILALFGATYWWIEQPPPGVPTKGYVRGRAKQTFKQHKGDGLQSSPPTTQGPEHGTAAQKKPLFPTLEPLWFSRAWSRKGPGCELPLMEARASDQGSTPIWKAQRVFDIIVGNAAGIELELNGKPLGPLGDRGHVVHLVLPKE